MITIIIDNNDDKNNNRWSHSQAYKKNKIIMGNVSDHKAMGKSHKEGFKYQVAFHLADN